MMTPQNDSISQAKLGVTLALAPEEPKKEL